MKDVVAVGGPEEGAKEQRERIEGGGTCKRKEGRKEGKKAEGRDKWYPSRSERETRSMDGQTDGRTDEREGNGESRRSPEPLLMIVTADADEDDDDDDDFVAALCL